MTKEITGNVVTDVNMLLCLEPNVAVFVSNTNKIDILWQMTPTQHIDTIIYMQTTISTVYLGT